MSGSPDGEDPSTRRKLAEDRTEFAEDRTIMAMERTFAGWMRTALAAIGIGLAFHALFGELQPPWLARAIASVFVALGAAVALGAERRVLRGFGRLSAHSVPAPKLPSLRWIAYSVALGAAILLAALWVSI